MFQKGHFMPISIYRVARPLPFAANFLGENRNSRAAHWNSRSCTEYTSYPGFHAALLEPIQLVKKRELNLTRHLVPRETHRHGILEYQIPLHLDG